MIVVGSVTLGGAVDPVYNAVTIVELAADKGAQTVLMPVTARKQPNDLPDELITKVNIVFYADVRDALLKAMVE